MRIETHRNAYGFLNTVWGPRAGIIKLFSSRSPPLPPRILSVNCMGWAWDPGCLSYSNIIIYVYFRIGQDPACLPWDFKIPGTLVVVLGKIPHALHAKSKIPDSACVSGMRRGMARIRLESTCAIAHSKDTFVTV